MSFMCDLRRLSRWLIVAALLAALAACGQKGPLYRPTKAKSTQAATFRFG